MLAVKNILKIIRRGKNKLQQAKIIKYSIINYFNLRITLMKTKSLNIFTMCENFVTHFLFKIVANFFSGIQLKIVFSSFSGKTLFQKKCPRQNSHWERFGEIKQRTFLKSWPRIAFYYSRFSPKISKSQKEESCC